jgi:ribonuclease R
MEILHALRQEGIVRVDDDGRFRYVSEKRKKVGTPPKLVGILRVSRRGTGSVTPESSDEPIAIAQRSMRTAMHGDTVAIVPFARKYSGARSGTGGLQGEVVEVLKRANERIVGRLGRAGHFFVVEPDDARIHRDVYVDTAEASKARLGDKVIVRLVPWEDEHLNPEGTIEEVLGPSGDPHVEVMSVAREFGLPLGFPTDVIDETDRFPKSISKEDLQGRLDYRDRRCFTIDPVDAKDFDDAISFERLANGTIRLGVHIADVSHYVREGSALDTEALQRGTSVYLVNEVIPMLPERLSNDLCSLKPKEDRLTYSVMMDLNDNGTVEEYEIRKSIIHSARRFTYEEVQKILDDREGELADVLLPLHNLTKQLHKRRRKNGSLDFDSTEVKFVFDEQGLPSKIVKKERLDAHRVVEECMLLANKTVAKHIGFARKEMKAPPFVYRVHDLPDPERLRDLASFVKRFGFSIDARNGVPSRELQKLLDRVKGSDVEYLINEVALRSMAKAIYSEKNIGHYGLAFNYYTHFTSPIRRYPDLVVHRLLEEYRQGVSPQRHERLSGHIPLVCKQSSDRERVALEAERASVKVMQVEYMKRHVGDVLEGVIGGVTEFGLFVEINDLMIEGLVRVRDLADDYYIFDEKQYALRGRSRGKVYRLGDRVNVQVVSVDPREHEIDLVIVK